MLGRLARETWEASGGCWLTSAPCLGLIERTIVAPILGEKEQLALLEVDMATPMVNQIHLVL